MTTKIINLSKEIKPILYKKDNIIKIWLYTNITCKTILKNNYWSATEAYGEYSQEEGQRILTLAETNFNEAFEIVASWEKEKSLPE